MHNRVLFMMLLLALLVLLNLTITAKNVEQWAVFELEFIHQPTGNGFVDDSLKAVFTNGENKISVWGFYNGGNQYKVRFMPPKTGEWKYALNSNIPSINGSTGSFQCLPATGKNRGMVKICKQYHFEYANGQPYYPFGTTVYSFLANTPGMENAAFQTLKESPFNKIRFCIFPQWQDYSPVQHRFYPFEVEQRYKTESGRDSVAFNLDKFDINFFQHLEGVLEKLMELGVEADIILFHPYDENKWGFDKLPAEKDSLYLRYLIARLGAYRNVWWSLANEYDFMKEKSYADWEAILNVVAENDPYGHLCSNHNAKKYYDNWNPKLTHASIQNGALVEDFGRAVILRDTYQKPVIYDEVCYEGDIDYRWGDLSGEELTYRFWQAMIAGTYASHGETYTGADSILHLVTGTTLRGNSPARIGFLRNIVEQTGYWEQVDHFWGVDNIAQAANGDFIIYFGKKLAKEWTFSLPKSTAIPEGTQFVAQIIDTWNMTTTTLSDTYITGKTEGYFIPEKNMKVVELPEKQYMAIRLIKKNNHEK